MDKHISSQFDAELTGVSSRVLELGGLVESQTRHAVYALAQFSSEVADQVVATERQVNALEVEIDAELASIIARRQPTARDLRLLMAISKITGNLESSRSWRRAVRAICHRLSCGWRPIWRPPCCAKHSMPLPAWM
jgi:phosphate transport system protein